MINKIIPGKWQDYIDDIDDKSIDMVLTDPPYNITACKWDVKIDLDEMFQAFNRVIKDNGAMCIFGSQPFTTDLINANRKYFKYEWIWNKNRSGNYNLANIRPLIVYENIIVFGKDKIKYNPIMETADSKNIRPVKKECKGNDITGMKKRIIDDNYDKYKRYPVSIINISSYSDECNSLNRFHPTQKPVKLFQYLIKTYTNENDIVLDCFSGSGTTAHACIELNRKYICFEKEKEYYDKSIERIKPLLEQGRMFA